MKTLTSITIRTSTGTTQAINVPDLQSAKDFIKIYADGQEVRFWEFMEITTIRYSIDIFEIDEDGDLEEIDSKEYVQTLNNFTLKV